VSLGYFYLRCLCCLLENFFQGKLYTWDPVLYIRSSFIDRNPIPSLPVNLSAKNLVSWPGSIHHLRRIRVEAKELIKKNLTPALLQGVFYLTSSVRYHICMSALLVDYFKAKAVYTFYSSEDFLSVEK
jgi:hypothetical protein